MLPPRPPVRPREVFAREQIGRFCTGPSPSNPRSVVYTGTSHIQARIVTLDIHSAVTLSAVLALLMGISLRYVLRDYPLRKVKTDNPDRSWA